MITRHILTIPGSDRRVHYRKCGTGPALLMIHQSPRSSAEYVELMEAWGAHFTCIAPDTPGFGQSDPLAGEPEITDFADALAEFCDALGIGKCAAYGFHSGGVIGVAAIKRRADLFSCLAVGGYAVWSPEEMALFGESYLPEWHPTEYGEHLTWLWNRMLEQSWFFPWFDIRDETRLPVAHADPAKVHRAIMEMLDSGNAYRAGYGAVLRAPRDIPSPGTAMPPVLITAFEGDPLHAHLERLGELPANWSAHSCPTPEAHQADSLGFLKKYAVSEQCPPLAEDTNEGWINCDGCLIHWRGNRAQETLTIHAPAAEITNGPTKTLSIDVPGHGLSAPSADIEATILATASLLGATKIDWPAPPRGDPELLYPDLTPDRFGNYLQRAWSAARAEAIFTPWYDANPASAISVKNNALQPHELAKRARARLRAGAYARDYHSILTRRQGSPQ